GAVEVAHAVHRCAPRAARLPPLGAAHARRPRTLPAVRLYDAGESRTLPGALGAGGLHERRSRALQGGPRVRIAGANWMQIERYLARDDRAVVPLGSTEQHAYLSLATDSILAERVAVEAAEPLAVPVLPALAYGLTPYFAAYPGSPSVRTDTYLAFVKEIVESLQQQGFQRFLLVN